MTERQDIRFLLNGTMVRLADVAARDTLLDHLRLAARLTGTKEGCAEGDCGACTVLVGRLVDGALRYEPVNACIRLLASVDGCHVVTVEHLRGATGALHPVQQAMVDFHGSQCGFCTPGIVMALYALWMENPAPTEAQVETALQGNLCRCTGYAPILRAAMAMGSYGSPAQDTLTTERATITGALRGLQDGQRVSVVRDGSRAILPADVDDLARVLVEHPDATIIAGATDVGLWVTKFLRPLPVAVFTAHLQTLRRVARTDDGLHIGAGASYAEASAALAAAHPHLAPYWDRIGGWQVRSMGTVGGNIANGSPIGDTPPVLIALGARITLRHGDSRREMPLEDFFLDYGKQDRRAGEFLEAITVPDPAPDSLHAAWKISKRRDEDISSIAVGFSVTRDGDRIAGARIAFGGMAATPRRAQHAEAALTGAQWSEGSFASAARALEQDFTPISDMRASAAYRMQVAQNLFRRFWLTHGAPATGPAQLERT